jgi:hypothetical protein
MVATEIGTTHPRQAKTRKVKSQEAQMTQTRTSQMMTEIRATAMATKMREM